MCADTVRTLAWDLTEPLALTEVEVDALGLAGDLCLVEHDLANHRLEPSRDVGWRLALALAAEPAARGDYHQRVSALAAGILLRAETQRKTAAMTLAPNASPPAGRAGPTGSERLTALATLLVYAEAWCHEPFRRHSLGRELAHDPSLDTRALRAAVAWLSQGLACELPK
jgi:hypothetical protein